MLAWLPRANAMRVTLTSHTATFSVAASARRMLCARDRAAPVPPPPALLLLCLPWPPAASASAFVSASASVSVSVLVSAASCAAESCAPADRVSSSPGR